MSRRGVAIALVLAFVVVPLAELYVVIQVGHVIGVIPTIVLLLVESLLGGWIVRREGARTWRALRRALSPGSMLGVGLPDRELADGALVLVGGTLLLAPGFLTDVVGFFFVLPFTRPVARRLLLAVVARRLLGATISPRAARRPPSFRTGGRDARGAAGSPGGRGAGQVIRGEVVDPRPDDER